MKKTLFIFAAFLLSHTTIANAATDWTPYLKPMLSGCEYLDVNEKLPKPYKASVVSKKVKVDSTDEIDGYGEKSLLTI